MGKKVITKLDHSKLAVITIIIFVTSMIPVLYLSGYVHASGDDYGYGALAHSVWLETHSIWRTLGAAVQNAVDCWYSWQGTWFTLFLFALQPEVFSPDAYWIVPWMMTGINIGATSLLMHYLLVKKCGFRRSTFCILNFGILFAMIQFFPRSKSGIFWYNGTAHYIVPYALAMTAVWCFCRFIESRKWRYWIGAVLCMSALGGCSYLAALLAPVILIYLLLVFGRKRKYAFWLLIPLAMEGIGLVISMLSPGNSARGGEEFGFSIEKIMVTVAESFHSGFLTIGEYFAEKPAVIVILLVLALVIWEGYMQMDTIPVFPMPLLFFCSMFCLYCAMFAPGIYAGVEVSGGVPNTIFQIFLLTTLACLVYGLGWSAGKLKMQKGDLWLKNAGLTGLRFRLMVAFPVIICGCIFVFLNKGTLKETTFYNCVNYIASGQADDYKAQMDERLAILLDDTKKDIELPMMNQDQGPLMHMEIMPDPGAWTNQVMKKFYQKDRIVRVDRVQN